MPSPRANALACLCGLLAVVTLAYSNHFRNSFHFDDSHTVIDNAYIRDLHNFGVIFSDARAFSALPSNRGYRPVVTASLAIDYALAGGLRPLYFHASTFLWFVVQLSLMYVLFWKIFQLARPDPRNQWAAILAASLYGIHPAIAETVNYVIQRGDVYSTLGVVASLLLYAVSPAARKYGWYLIPMALGILSKPPALIFPLILFAYVRLFEETRLLPAVKKCVPALLMAAALGYLVVRMTPPTFVPIAGSSYAYRITQPLVALRYFRSFFIPNRLSADTDFSAVNSVFEGGAWAGFVFAAALAAAAIWCSKKSQWRPVAFGLWWFLLALVPTSLFPLSEVENDHRMYFPFVGLMLAFSWLVALALFRYQPLRRFAAVAVAAAGIVIFSASLWATRQRNETWRTDESLWLDVTIKSPRNGRGLMNYGLTQMEKGDYRRALDYFERAVVFTPAYSFLEINLGIANGGLNLDAAAEQHFLRALALAPNSAESHYFYGRWLKDKNRIPAASAELEKAVAVNPDYMAARYLTMQIDADQADWIKLRAAADNTLERFPHDQSAAAFLARANSSNHVGSTETADQYVNLSLAYYRAGQYEDCIKAAQQALKLQPSYAVAYNNMAAAYAAMRDWDSAIAAAQQALKILPDFQLARNNLAWAVSQKRASGR